MDLERPANLAGTVLASLFQICYSVGGGSKLDSCFLIPKYLRIGELSWVDCLRKGFKESIVVSRLLTLAGFMVLRTRGDACLPFGEREVKPLSDGNGGSKLLSGEPCAAVRLADGTARVLVRRLGVPSLDMT